MSCENQVHLNIIASDAMTFYLSHTANDVTGDQDVGSLQFSTRDTSRCTKTVFTNNLL